MVQAKYKHLIIMIGRGLKKYHWGKKKNFEYPHPKSHGNFHLNFLSNEQKKEIKK